MPQEPLHDPQRTVDQPQSPDQLPTLGGQGSEPSTPAAKLTAKPSPKAERFVIPGYVITGEIARGGMGRVLAGREEKLDREVAIKVLLPGANADRFVIESKITAKLPHPNIPPIYALGTLTNGSPFLAMKLIRGRTLAEELKARPDLADNLPRWVQVFEQIAQAVGFAHAQGVIHRDLKPANVMVGSFGEVQVMDWGLARSARIADHGKPSEGDSADVPESDSQLTQSGSVLGTPAYMAPEQARGETVDSRADVFALGGILTAILTGKAIFSGKSSLETIRQAASGDTSKALARLESSRADAELIELAKDCLKPMAAARPSDGLHVAERVSAYRRGVEERLQKVETDRAASEAKAIEQRKRRRSMRIASAVIATVLVMGIAVSGYFAYVSNQRANKEAAANKLAEDRKNEADAAAADAKAQAKRADLAAEDAKNQAKRADREAGIANSEKTIAQEQRDQAERLVYPGKLIQAQNAFAEGNGRLTHQHLEETQWNLRGWEFRHLWNRFNSKQTFQGHTASVLSVAWSPDGKKILSGGDSGDEGWGQAKIWDAETGREILKLQGHEDNVTSAVWSQDGTRILTGSSDKTAKIWDAITGKVLMTLPMQEFDIFCAAWSPDGKRFVTSGVSQAKVWDAEKAVELFPLKNAVKQDFAFVRSLAWSPDGKRIAVADSGSSTSICDSAKGAFIRTFVRKKQEFPEKSDVFGAIAWSPDGRRVVWASINASVCISDAETGIELADLRGHVASVECVAWSPDGQRIATGSKDGTAKLWDAVTGRELETLQGHSQSIRSVAWSPDGRRIVTGSEDKSVKVWDAENAQEIPAFNKHTDSIHSVSWSPDGKRFVTGSGDASAKVWDAEKRLVLFDLQGHKSAILCVAWNPRFPRILTGDTAGVVSLWDAETGQLIRTKHAQTSELFGLSWSPDGKRFFTGDSHNKSKVWDAEKGTELFALARGGESGVSAWSPDGKWILTEGGQSMPPYQWDAKVWDAVKGSELKTFSGHTGKVRCVAWSPRSDRILTGGADSLAKVWDAQKGSLLFTLQGHARDVLSVAWSPDGKRIITGSQDKTMKVWDAERGTELLTLKGHTGGVTSLQWSTDGQSILSGSDDKTARVWTDGAGPGTLWINTEFNGIANLAWSPDSARVFAWDFEGKVQAWSMLSGKSVAPIDPPAKPKTYHPTSTSPDGRRNAKVERSTAAMALTGMPFRVAIRDAAPQTNPPWPLPGAEERKRYHTERLAVAKRESLEIAVAFHLGRLLQDDPENLDLKKRREEAAKKLAPESK